MVIECFVVGFDDELCPMVSFVVIKFGDEGDEFFHSDCSQLHVVRRFGDVFTPWKCNHFE